MSTNENSHLNEPSFWIDAWYREAETSQHKNKAGYAGASFWNTLSHTYDDHFDEAENRYLDKTIGILQDKDIIGRGAKVLDIGCGTGRLSFKLANAGCKVTAIDFSQGMLDEMEAACPDELRDHITIRRLDWTSVDVADMNWAGAFDLVASHMTPATKLPHHFLPIFRATRAGYLVKTWAEPRRNAILADLWKKVTGTDMADRIPDLFFIGNLLFTLGVFPDIHFRRMTRTVERTVEDTVEHYSQYFLKVTGKTEQELKELIRRHVGGINENGRVSETMHGRTALLVGSIESEKQRDELLRLADGLTERE